MYPRTPYSSNFGRAFLNLVARHRSLGHLLGKAYRLWRREGFLGVRNACRRLLANAWDYDAWVRQHDTLSESDRAAIVRHAGTFSYRPHFSVVMPVFNAPERWLRAAIESVRAQIYTEWELCIADDASTEAHVRPVLEEYARMDSRIQVVFREMNGHISAASNSALALACGEFIVLLDHDDELPPHALYMVAHALNENPHLDLIYSDEDKIDERGLRYGHYFKPDWNPDLFCGQNLVSHLGVYRTSLVREIGGFREGYEGSQDWDLALRASERIPTKHIYHIPHVLYHWRAIEGSAALGEDEKPYAADAAERLLRDHLARTGQEGEVTRLACGHFWVRHALASPAPLVSIIIQARNGLGVLRRCIGSIQAKTVYAAYELLVVANPSDDLETLAYLRGLESAGDARVLCYDAPFNYPAINNFAAREARGEYLCLLNNDIEVLSGDWLGEMVSQAVRPGIGAVGALLYYPNDTIQHAGVVLGMGGVAGHSYLRYPKGTSGYMNRACLVQNLSALTAACLVVSASIYHQVGGMDAENLPVAFNDVDFCLRVVERGYRNVWTPFAELYHHESATRGYEDTPEKRQRFQKELEYMRQRWGHLLERDPCYNPNLSLDHPWPRPASPPRVRMPWRVDSVSDDQGDSQ